jgi:hypothetical protein
MAGQLWGVNSLGGYCYSLELSNIVRSEVQPLLKFRQFCDALDFTDKGLHTGQTFSWNAYAECGAAGHYADRDVHHAGNKFYNYPGNRDSRRVRQFSSLSRTA